MKNINKYVYLLLVSLMFSCNDATDIDQDGLIYEEDGFTTLRHIESGVSGCYAAFTPDAGDDVVYFSDIFTDNMRKGESNTGAGSEEYNFLLQSNSSAPAQIWGNRYAAINRVNRTLAAIDRLYDGFTEQEQLKTDYFKGQLLGLRALLHFDLFQMFTPDYKDPNGKAVIKMDFVPLHYSEVYPRNTVSEIATFINSDIAEAIEILNNVDEKPGEAYETAYYLTPTSLKFIKAKLELFTGNYSVSKTIIEEIIPELNGLASKTVYEQMFKDTADGEAFFILARRNGGVQIGSNYFFNSSGGVKVDDILQVSRQLYELYSVNDVRRGVVVRNGNSAGLQNYILDKYPGSSSGYGPFINNLKYFRFSEVKLILAELKARTGDLAGAAQEIRAIRTARIGTNTALTYADLTAALTDVMLERRKELCFEGHRYLDIKRIGREVNIGVNRDASDASTFSGPIGLPASDYRFTLPIPKDEIFANPTIDQNPNY